MPTFAFPAVKSDENVIRATRARKCGCLLLLEVARPSAKGPTQLGTEPMTLHSAMVSDAIDRREAQEDVLVRYDPATILLHWATAFLVIALWVLGQTSDWWPRGFAQTTSWSIHVTLGLALACILVTRIVWRIGPGRALPAADDGILHTLARMTHVGLYGLLIVVVSLGVADALVRGFVLFGVLPLPQLGDRAMRGVLNHWHGLAANAVLVLAGLHAAAALFHHYVRKDELLRRMWRVAPGEEGRDLASGRRAS